MRTLLLLLLTCSATAWAQPYDETADAAHDIQAALRQAHTDGRFVLLNFGANWCPDCLVLAEQMGQTPLRELIEGNFVVVKIDIGEGEKNRDLVEQYGNVTQRGIPSIVVLDRDNRVLLGTLTGRLAHARSMGMDETYRFFVSVIQAAKSVPAREPGKTAR